MRGDYCPVNSDIEICCGKSCAWYCESENRCAVMQIAKAITEIAKAWGKGE